MAFASYRELKRMKHLSRARSDFHADVIYEDDVLDAITLNNTPVIYQHSYNNVLTIPALEPHTTATSTSASRTSSSLMAAW